MITVFAAPGIHSVGDALELDDEESRHVQVRRAQDGDPCIALDGAGTVIHGVLARGDKRWHIRAERIVHVARPAATVIAVAAGDRDRFLWIAEKCAELNVTRIIPLLTDRQRNVENRLRDVGVDRARRRAREACKQSGNPWSPLVDDVTPLDQLVAHGRWLMADGAGGRCPAIGNDEEIAWIIGPEGGLTAGERAFCTTALGAMPVSFGATVLRFETAALAAAAMTLDRRSAPAD